MISRLGSQKEIHTLLFPRLRFSSFAKWFATLFATIGLAFNAHAVDVDWENIGFANDAFFNSGITVAATNNACVPGVTTCDATATVTFEIVNDGQGGEIECGWSAGANCARYYTSEFGGINDDNLRFGVDATGADNDDYFNMCVEFDRVVEGLSFDLQDIDDAGWDDVAELYYTSAPSATAMLARTDLINGSAFGDVSTGTDPNHVVAHDPSFAAPDNEAQGWGSIQPGGGNAGNTDDGGNVTIDFGATQVWGFCVRYWAGPNSDANPPFQWIGLTGLNWTASLPVSLDHFTSHKHGNNLEVEWTTSSESFNIGFNLWGEIDGEWVALNRNFIPSEKVNSFSLQKYKKKIRLNKTERSITELGISSVDSLGKEEFFGPFDIGSDYGEQSVPEPIDWQQVVDQKSRSMLANGFVKRNGRWIKQSRLKPLGDINNTQAELRFDQDGMVRLTHSDLLEAGLDLSGLRANQIAVSRAGKPVPRVIKLGSKKKVFNEESAIDFFAAKLSGELALYNSENVYRISTDTNLVSRARNVKLEGESENNSVIFKTVSHEQDRYYLNVSTTGSPWLDQSIGYGAKPTVDFPLDIPDDYVEGSDVEIELNLMGGFDFPTIEEDHHLTASVNGQIVFDQAWGGIDAKNFTITIPGVALNDSGNVLSLTANKNTANIGLLLFDNYTLKYQADATLVTGAQRFTRDAESLSTIVKLDVESKGRVWAYGRDEAGNLVKLAARRSMVKSSSGERVRTLEIPALSDPKAEYLLVHNDGFLKPNSIDVVSRESKHIDQASLYIIAGATFIGEDIQDYVEFKRASGISTELVSYQDLIASFGHGFNDPMAIKRFLEQQNGLDTKTSVLLVGGHTYDYLNRTGQSSVSFIPSVYRPSSVIQFSPTDTPIADLDSDGLADVAIGRWPVRTLEQLKVIVDKSTAWANGEGLANSSSVLLIAESDDTNNELSFANQLDGIASRYDDQAPNYANYWGNITRTYASDFNDSEQPIADQQTAIKEGMNSGNALTIYSGHGSPTTWSFKRLLDVNGINDLDVNDTPGIVIPLACYTTYFETISNESLANKLLFKADAGAVMIVGASTLGDYSVNGKMVKRMMRYQAKDGLTMGQALRQAKRSMGQSKLDKTNLWTMLGDPTLRFNQTYTHQVSASKNTATEG